MDGLPDPSSSTERWHPSRGTSPTGVFGRRAFIAGAAGALAVGSLLSSPVSAAVSGASFFQPLAPRRLCDTRRGFGFTRVAENWIRIRIAGNGDIPADAVAVVVSLTGVNRGRANWLSAFPTGEPWPGTSSLNMGPFDTAIANLTTVKLGVRGQIDVLALAPSDVVVDIAGVYRPAPGAVRSGRYQALAEVVRVLDTRNRPGKPAAGSVVTVNLNGIVPADAAAVITNLTAVDAAAPGWLAAYPTGTARPLVSNVNLGTGEVRSVGTMTKLNTAKGVRGFDIYTLRSCHIVVDVAGYITGPGARSSESGLFVPVSPTRMLDTRRDRLGGTSRLWPGWTRAFTLPEPIRSKAQAVAMNVTVTQTMGPGFFTLYGTGTPRRLVSNLNASRPLQTVANHAIVRLSTAGIAGFTKSGAHLICDVTGWFTGTPARVTEAPPVNPPPPGGPTPWTIQVPAMGLAGAVFDGAYPDPVVDAGHSWHWSGTGRPGEGAAISIFGHRTEHGGPYRYQHLLRPGDVMYLYTSDGRRFEYRLAAETITSSYALQILGATRQVPGETVSLIACTRTNRLPTDTDYRLVSTFTFVGWIDLA